MSPQKPFFAYEGEQGEVFDGCILKELGPKTTSRWVSVIMFLTPVLWCKTYMTVPSLIPVL